MAGALRLRHDQRQTREQALPAAFQRHGRDVDLRVFPQQHVVREVNAVLRREFHIGDRDIRAFDLAERVSELDLRHVLAARQLRPARLRDRFRHG